MSDHDAPGTVLQVGMRATFHAAPDTSGMRFNGSACTIEAIDQDAYWPYFIRFTAGDYLFAASADELAPLPSASSGATTEEPND